MIQIKPIHQHSMMIIGFILLYGIIIFIDLPSFNKIREVLGVIFVVFLPGYSWNRLIFSSKHRSVLEQTMNSLVLSIALVAITAFTLGSFGVSLSVVNLYIEVSLITILGVIGFYIQKFIT